MRTVEIRVVDQALPTDRGAGFFKVDAHHQQQLVMEFAVKFCQTFGIFNRRLRIVNRTGPDDHHHTWVTVPEDVLNLRAGFGDEFGILFGKWQDLFEICGSDKRGQAADIEIVRPNHECLLNV